MPLLIIGRWRWKRFIVLITLVPVSVSSLCRNRSHRWRFLRKKEYAGNLSSSTTHPVGLLKRNFGRSQSADNLEYAAIGCRYLACSWKTSSLLLAERNAGQRVRRSIQNIARYSTTTSDNFIWKTEITIFSIDGKKERHQFILFVAYPHLLLPMLQTAKAHAGNQCSLERRLEPSSS